VTLALSRKSAPSDVRSERRLDLAFYAVGALVIAGIVHIGSVLLLPRRSEADAFARIRALSHGALLQTVVGPPAAAGFLPYRDPAMSTSYCMYDLDAGPVRISINVSGSDFLTVSTHGRHGRAFYALTNRSASHGTVALTLMTAAQITAAETQDTGEGALQDLRVLAPEPKGFVAVQALAVTPSATGAADAEVRKLLCRSDKRD
jgi:uncharacterized membrane protein